MGDEGRIRLIVGLDFGTTFSGLSYVLSNAQSSDKIEVVDEWPGHGYTSWKAPSAIAYASEDNRLGTDEWGFTVPAGAKRYTWTKLLLDKDTLPTDHDDPQLRGLVGDGLLRLPPGKSAEAVCEDFLRGMHRHLQQVLVKRFGAHIVDVTPVDCWITVPALWSDKAVALTRKAAVGAGFAARSGDSVNIIKEPEAAALAVMKPMLEAGTLNPLRVNEDIMICDCGGGTVDLATYRITALTPRLEFKELCVGSGGKCGSTYIDRNFLVWMEKRFGDAFTSILANRRGPGSRFMGAFEAAKRRFGSQDAQGDTIPIGNIYMSADDSSMYDGDEGLLKLPRYVASRV